MKICTAGFTLPLLAALLTGGCASQSSKHDREEKISLESAPAAVQASVRRVAGDSKIEKLAKENENGQVVYEAEFEANGMDHSATISSTGEVLEEENEMNAADLPQTVAAAVRNKYPDAKVEEANLIKSKGTTSYEVLIRAGETKRELRVSTSGEVQGDKVKNAKPKKDEDHDRREGKDEQD